MYFIRAYKTNINLCAYFCILFLMRWLEHANTLHTHTHTHTHART